MYVAVKGGEKAVQESRKLVAEARRGDTSIPEISSDQIENQLGLSVDRVMAEGSLFDPRAAAIALKQAQGDTVEAIFLVRAFRSTLKRFGVSQPIDTDVMQVIRRISGVYKDIPGGQILGPTYDYTQRLIDFDLGSPSNGAGQDQEPVKIKSLPETGDAEKFMRVLDLLKQQGLMKEIEKRARNTRVEDLTRDPMTFPAPRGLRLQNLARGDEGFLLGSAYSLQRGFGLDRHPFLGELRVGVVSVRYLPQELGFEIEIGRIKVTECFMVNRVEGTEIQDPGFENGYGLVFGHNERKAMSMSLLDKSLKAGEGSGKAAYPAQDQEFILSHSDNVESSGFVQHLKLPHYVDFQSELVFVRNLKEDRIKEKEASCEPSI